MEGNQTNRDLLFYSWKETPTKDIPNECTDSIVHEEHHENGFTNIRKVISDNELVNPMNDLELRPSTLFADMVKNFLGNRRVENYKELVKKLFKSLQDIGANMSIKVHFSFSHLDEFPDNCNYVSDE